MRNILRFTHIPRFRTFKYKPSVVRCFSNQHKGNKKDNIPKQPKLDSPKHSSIFTSKDTEIDSPKNSIPWILRMIFRKHNDVTRIMKQMYFFKKYLLPSRKQNPFIFNLVSKSYMLLAMEKSLIFTMPLSLKFGIDSLKVGEPPYFSILMFSISAASMASRTYFGGRRIINNSRLTRLVFMETSAKVFESLLKMDLQATLSGTRTFIFSTNKAKKGLEQNFSMISMTFVPILFEFSIASVVLLYFYGPFYFAIFISSLFGYIRYTKKTALKRKYFMQSQHKYDKKADFLINESMNNFFIVKGNSTEKYEKSKYSSSLENYVESFTGSQFYLATLNLGQSWYTSGGMAFSMILACLAVSSGTLTIGDLVFLRIVIDNSYRPLFNMGNMYLNYMQTIIEMKDLLKILNHDNEINEKPDAVELKITKGEIQFKNIDMHFEGNVLLSKFNFTVKPSTLVILTGESGIGKSSLLNLLSRFYDPENGEVEIDGQNIRDVTFDSLRKQISYCPQEAMMFNDTILNNLMYGNLEKYYEIENTEVCLEKYVLKEPNTVPEDIIKVCKDLDLHDKIMSLEKGYFDSIGDSGLKFSGGERQRISIARAFLKDSQVLIFDEPTNGLDAFNEQRFFNLISKKKDEGKTVIIVTHKLNLSLISDEILCLVKGGKIEKGTHHQLSNKKDSRYSLLYKTYIKTSKMEMEEDINMI